MSIAILFVLNALCLIYFVTPSVAVFESAIRVKSMYTVSHKTSLFVGLYFE